MNAHLQAWGDLYGGQHPLRIVEPRAEQDLLHDLARGCESLHAMTSTWLIVPAPGDLAGAVSTCEGIRRILAELRQHCEGRRDGN